MLGMREKKPETKKSPLGCSPIPLLRYGGRQLTPNEAKMAHKVGLMWVVSSEVFQALDNNPQP